MEAKIFEAIIAKLQTESEQLQLQAAWVVTYLLEAGIALSSITITINI